MRRQVVGMLLLLAAAGTALAARNDFIEFVSGVHHDQQAFRFDSCLRAPFYSVREQTVLRPAYLTDLKVISVQDTDNNPISYRASDRVADQLQLLQNLVHNYGAGKVSIILVINPSLALIGGSTSSDHSKFEFHVFQKKSLVGQNMEFKGNFCFGSANTLWYKFKGEDWRNPVWSAIFRERWGCLNDVVNKDLILLRNCLQQY